MNARPCISNDLWVSRVIALAVQSTLLDIDALLQLEFLGPLSKVQIYDFQARRLEYSGLEELKSTVVKAGLRGELGLAELSLVSVRTLLLQNHALDKCQIAFAQKRYLSSVREVSNGGSGIWLGARATVKALSHALESILRHSSSHMDQLALVLLSPDGQVNADVLAVAKKFKQAVMVQYRSEAELVDRLRALKMHVFVEMHGLQNASSFIDSLRFGVAPVQLSWAGLPESCPLPFMDGQLLDSILAQAKHASCRPIPLRCWLPPAVSAPSIVRGNALGIWAMNSKITEAFVTRCQSLSEKTGREIQIYGSGRRAEENSLQAGVTFVSDLQKFTPTVLLDTYPLSGGNSCLFALQSGIPVVTLPGHSISSRLGASILYNYGFHEGVATNEDHYSELVQEFCSREPQIKIARSLPWECVETINSFFGD